MANIAYATRLAATIKHEIELGVFSFARHFPDSPHALLATPNTFEKYGELWLASKSDLAAATRNQYALAIAAWAKRVVRARPLGIMPICELKHSDVAALVGSVPWPSARMKNNSMIPLRGIFNMATRDGAFQKNPLEGVKNSRFQLEPPDPLSEPEAERIIVRMYARYGLLIGAYFELAFFTGLRPEELIALRWAKIDWHARTVRIDVVRTFRGGERPTKTYQVRDLELGARAFGVLLRLKPCTWLATHGHVLENPRTAKPWHDERSQRDHYWHPVLKVEGIRDRRPYQTRHSWATMALMRGCNPSWVSRMLGHKNAKMLHEIYAKWIDKADKGREISKFDAANLGRQLDLINDN